jgi:hypothetical protein
VQLHDIERSEVFEAGKEKRILCTAQRMQKPCPKTQASARGKEREEESRSTSQEGNAL